MKKTKHYLLSFLLLFLIGLEAQSALAQTPDPSQRGPFATTSQEYNFGDTAFTPSGFPAAVEERAVVFRPTDLTQGPYPVVIFLHGRHSTCFQGSSQFLEWPCASGHSPIPSFRGYDYVADVMASNGYFVVSISANGINARDNNTNDLGAGARAQLIQRHLDLLKQFNTTGGAPFGTTFVGRIDLTRVGTMGHSRGGEGVLRHFLFNRAQPSPYPIKVIVPIAPTNFSRWQVNDGVAVAQLLSYCDGDVTNIQGLHAYDDARYKMPNAGYQQYVSVMGGNHNFYNRNWTPGSGFPANDDWSNGGDPHCGTGAGNGRLTAAQQRSVATAYLPAFFRSELGGEAALKPLIDGSGGLAPSVSTFNLHITFHAADPRRRDLNRLLTADDLTTNFLGGAVRQTGLTPQDLCGGNSPQPQNCLANQAASRQPHTAASSNSNLRGLSQLRTGWGALGALFVNEVPAGVNRDVSDFQFFQFRTTVNFSDSRNPSGQAQDFSVRFTDETGASQSLRAGQFSSALFFPPGTTGPVPKVWHNTVRIPLSNLTSVDTRRITQTELLFDQRGTGALLISDLHFYGNAAPPTPNFSLSATPASQTVTAGNSTSYTVSATPSGGFTGTIALSVSGLPAGATASFNPTSIAGGSGSSTLTVTTASTTPSGTFSLTITGASGTLQRSTTVTLVVNTAQQPDFTIAATPASRTITQGQSTTYTVNIGSVGGFARTVNLSASGLPSGATASFDPAAVSGGSGSSTMTVTTSSTTPTGTFTITITGTSGSLTHSTTVSLTVQAVQAGDFNLNVSPSSQSVTAGFSAFYFVTAASVNGFSGSVNLSISGLPSGATASFSPVTLNLQPDGSGFSFLVVRTSTTTPSGTFNLVITGTSGAIVHSRTVQLIVRPQQ